MDIRQALREAVDELGWSPAHLAAAALVSEAAAKKWLAGASIPSGDTLLRLMRAMPGLRKRLGYELVQVAA